MNNIDYKNMFNTDLETLEKINFENIPYPLLSSEIDKYLSGSSYDIEKLKIISRSKLVSIEQVRRIIDIMIEENNSSIINPSIADVDPDDLEYFTWENKTFIAKPSHVYDGDTFTATWCYNNELIKYRCRCLGYDSPEMKPRLNNPDRDEIKIKANIAKERFIQLLNQDPTITIVCGEFDKYGRVLVNIYNDTNGEKSINDMMIDEGFGYVYHGGTKQK